MESLAAYFDRKHEELWVLNQCLRTPLDVVRPRSVVEIIGNKFRLTAALKAQHELDDWAFTETAWAHGRRRRSGPFEFSYDYQRADLDVQGPSFYTLDPGVGGAVIYTASGMAAISALLLASAHIFDKADILVLPGSYSETQEVIEGYARHLRPVTVKGVLGRTGDAAASRRILLLDSSAPADAFADALRSAIPALDLLIFDTTCFSAGSGRIRQVLRRAREWDVPVVMVRSHTKLDSLGVEYGRLGSAMFIARPDAAAPDPTPLSTEMRNAVRLLGSAAVPAHFPPYMGTPAYRELSRRRMAAVLRNSRRSQRYLASALADFAAQPHLAQGLYLPLAGNSPLDEEAARRIAAAISDDLSREGFAICHAGSFGFDFAATEWFCNRITSQYCVRIAVPDLPTELWDDLTKAIATWWSRHVGA